MPTIYHDNCGKPGPKSNDYIPPPDARLFKSRSAPNSPMLVRQTLFPPRTPRTHDRSPASPRLRRAATLFVEKRKIEKTEKTESKSKEIKSEQKWKIGRSRSFNNKSEQKNSLGKVWHPGCLRCEECGKRLNPGQHSEHRGIPYCNIPCYSMLFGPGGFGHGGTESHTNYGQEKTNSEELEALRNEIIPKLKAYNTYFKDQKASQLSSKEVNGRIILEGVLKVYWGLKNPVTLGNHRLGDWRRQSHRGSKSQTTEKNVGIKTKAAVGKENITQSQSAQRPRSTSIEKILARRRSIERQQSRNNSVGNDKKEQSFSLFNGRRLRRQTSFTPPHGTSTNLRLTSRIPTREVVKMLLAKFQITDNPNKFNIYARYDNGAIRRLNKNEYPLLCRLLLGANEEIVKLYIMGSDDTNDISEEVAQYIHFSLPVLEAFLKKFKEEEEREVEKIKESYGQYRALLQKRLSEISTSV